MSANKRNQEIYESLKNRKKTAIELAAKYNISRGRVYQIYDSVALKLFRKKA